MKALLLTVIAFCFAACDVEKITGTRSAEATPEATPTPKAKPTPKPGDWMFKNYKNPLDKRPGKEK